MAKIKPSKGAPYARILGVGGYRPTRVVSNEVILERIDHIGSGHHAYGVSKYQVHDPTVHVVVVAPIQRRHSGHEPCEGAVEVLVDDGLDVGRTWRGPRLHYLRRGHEETSFELSRADAHQ